MPEEVTATAFLEQLDSLASAGERLRMGQIFGLAKEYVDMEPDEIEKLLDGPSHEARVGTVSIMGKQATRKRTPETRRNVAAMQFVHGGVSIRPPTQCGARVPRGQGYKQNGTLLGP